MNHEGKARRAGFKILVTGLLGWIVVFGTAGWEVGAGLLYFWMTGAVYAILALFTLYFFRDPTARPPNEAGTLLAPAHGKVDVVDETEEAVVMGGHCRRVSIFLSVFDVHVQQAPVSGKVTFVKHTSGKFLNAIHPDCALANENVLIGIELEKEPGVKIGVRLIAGLIARRILPWIKVDETVVRGRRISMIQFGSRCDLYFPMDYQVKVAPGDRVTGGETVVAAKT